MTDCFACFWASGIVSVLANISTCIDTNSSSQSQQKVLLTEHGTLQRSLPAPHDVIGSAAPATGLKRPKPDVLLCA